MDQALLILPYKEKCITK